MAHFIPIHDFSSPELDIYFCMTQAQSKNKQYQKQGIFIAEGLTTVEIALNAGKKPLSFLLDERHVSGKAEALLNACPNIPAYMGSKELLSQLTGFTFTRGFLCAMERGCESRLEEIISCSQKLAILENIADPSNMGSIFRNAAALGIDGIILSPSCCDPYYRKAVRTSMGTIFQIRWTRSDRMWPDDTMEQLHSSGFSTIAMALEKDADPLENVLSLTSGKIAVLLGNEGHGLQPSTIATCTHCAYLPMQNNVNSLNVASASAIAFWQMGKY